MELILVAAVAAFVPSVCAFTLVGLVRAQQRAHARREDLLINQLLHAAGKAWQPPPADNEWDKQNASRLPKDQRIRYTPSPEQLPVQ